jgi:hypothetical protein
MAQWRHESRAVSRPNRDTVTTDRIGRRAPGFVVDFFYPLFAIFDPLEVGSGLGQHMDSSSELASVSFAGNRLIEWRWDLPDINPVSAALERFRR